MVLENPAADDKFKSPLPGKANALVDLSMGKKINIPGPIQICLWPGQIANVVAGHRLRSNQYLVARVYNNAEAVKNWKSAVVTTVPKEGEGEGEKNTTSKVPDLTIGQLLIIKGTEVSFYIPPTGIEVCPAAKSSNNYINDAVTLESLEYCILLKENGDKRYIDGPAVVFPEPDENFLEENGSRKFKAYELDSNMGLYIKVIAPYEDNGVKHERGEEMFITGKDTNIYIPRPEHSLINYGSQQIHFATAIPAGEARYVLDKKTGNIKTVKGPMMFLADPRNEVLVRRVLDVRQCDLFYPGNEEVLTYNASLRQIVNGASNFVTQRQFAKNMGRGFASGLASPAAAACVMDTYESAEEPTFGDSMTRSAAYTPPQTIQLDTKYDGAVAINVWTGYAVQVISKTGGRRVEVGPCTVLLDYDETLEMLTLSTGKPKTTDKLLNTVYLGIFSNKVSDIISAETSDMVSVSVKVSYRVDFDKEQKDKWFSVSNYVKLMCDHFRSKIRNAVKRVGIEEFNANAIDLIRDTVLGVKPADGSKRVGMVFNDNGMIVNEVEVLEVSIGDSTIKKLLVDQQQASVKNALTIADKERELETAKRTNVIDQELVSIRLATSIAKINSEKVVTAKNQEVEIASIETDGKKAEMRSNIALASEKVKKEQVQIVAEAQQIRDSQEIAAEEERQALAIALLNEQTKAHTAKLTAISPQLVASITSLGDKELAIKLAEASAPLAILGGTSCADAGANLLKGLGVDEVIKGLLNKKS